MTETSTPDHLAVRVRSIAVSTLVLLSAIAIVAAGLTGWARASVLDSSRFASLTRDALERPEVVDPLADRVAGEVVGVLADRQVLEGLLPQDLQGFAPVIAASIRSLVDDAVRDVLARDEVLDLLEEVIRRSHEAAMTLLRGDGLPSGVTVDDGEVRLDLLVVVELVLDGLRDGGVISAEVAVGDEIGDRRARLDALGRALGTDLPDDFGELVVYDSAAVASGGRVLAEAQRAVALFERATTALAVVALALVVAAVWLSPRRRRTAIHLVVAVGLAAVAVRTVIARVVADAPDLVAGGDAGAAVGSVVESATAGAQRLTTILVVAAALIGATVFLTGPSDTARRLRAWAGTEGRAGRGVLELVAQHPDGARATLAVSLAVLVAWWGLSAGSVVVLTVLAFLGLAGVAVAERSSAIAPAEHGVGA
ncbi:MAG TPA: hypothetical protein VK866_08140 [Acidimicrobiales bacterium]|nr:hypothetical protein [Acidimicrobiales bacterium]